MCNCKENVKGHRHVYCDECGKRIEKITLLDNENGVFVCKACFDEEKAIYKQDETYFKMAYGDD